MTVYMAQTSNDFDETVETIYPDMNMLNYG